MATYVGGEISKKTFFIWFAVGLLLIAGAIASSLSERAKNDKTRDQQGCMYYVEKTFDEVPVACYDFFDRNNHWKES